MKKILIGLVIFGNIVIYPSSSKSVFFNHNTALPKGVAAKAGSHLRQILFGQSDYLKQIDQIRTHIFRSSNPDLDTDLILLEEMINLHNLVIIEYALNQLLGVSYVTMTHTDLAQKIDLLKNYIDQNQSAQVMPLDNFADYQKLITKIQNIHIDRQPQFYKNSYKLLWDGLMAGGLLNAAIVEYVLVNIGMEIEYSELLVRDLAQKKQILKLRVGWAAGLDRTDLNEILDI